MKTIKIISYIIQFLLTVKLRSISKYQKQGNYSISWFKFTYLGIWEDYYDGPIHGINLGIFNLAIFG